MEDSDLEAKKALDAEFDAVMREYGITDLPAPLENFEEPREARKILELKALDIVWRAKEKLRSHKAALLSAQNNRRVMTEYLIDAKALLDAASKLEAL